MRVGRVVRLLEDVKRREIYTDKNENRKVLVNIYYPTDAMWSPTKEAYYKDMHSPREEFFLEKLGEGNEKRVELLKQLRINTFDDAPISPVDEKHPVVVLSPGLGSTKDDYLFVAEELVRNGYIVLSIGHIHDSNFTIMPDGSVHMISEKFKSISRDTMLEAIDVRKKDIMFILDELESINNKDEMFKNRMDLDKIGGVGHSLGGASIFEGLRSDMRMKSAVLLDGSTQYMKVEDELTKGRKLDRPLLNLRKGLNRYEERMKYFVEANEDDLSPELFKKYLVGQHYTVIDQVRNQDDLFKYVDKSEFHMKINNTVHLTFSDWFTLKRDLLRDDMICIEKAHEIIVKATVSFFNQYLCKSTSEYTELLDGKVYEQLEFLK